jgi:DNA ligase (NAD+)
MPARCPSCGSTVEADGPLVRCPNRFGCPAQLVGRRVHFASEGALDIEGLGVETASLLVNEGLVRSLGDLFRLRAADLEPLPRFAARSAHKLAEAIAGAKQVGLARFLYALGIPGVGAAVARDLAAHFGTWPAVERAGADALCAVPGIGPATGAAIRGFLDDPRHRRVIADLRDAGVTIGRAVQPRRGALAGTTIVFTGGLGGLTRSDAAQRAREAGARVTSSVSASTDYVVVGADPGSKLADARRLGVRTITEAQFRRLLGGARAG